MRLATNILLKLNKCFNAPVHPFNLQNNGVMSYAKWQYEKGADTIKFYLDFCDKDDMFFGKTVVDIGCGAGGKSLFYASCRAKEVIGVEILEKYEAEATSLANELGLSDKFRFITADAASLPFDTDSIDTIIMNDAMEHVAKPDEVLSECLRVLKKGGRLFVNFPPINHPFGAHLSDLIYIPWVHLFFSEKTLIEAYKILCKNVPDGDERIKFRISERENGEEYFSYINHMSIKRFNRILTDKKVIPAYIKHIPLRGFLKPLSRLPLLKECFVKMVVCVFEK